ncbi:glycolate oxidase [Alicyclobacillus ferrooxydans]|uniref:Glycolate oxidase n=2 Tax=Alicyclobacillus ferrooxydans TaxID=471514 RepID=A0A0N8PNY9_9BACL|nr:glycolate oxidase [Alicyclobacillus ferrooxydans]
MTKELSNQAPVAESADSFVPQFDMNEIMNCMRCGFCLPACPTFRETGKEYASPRGRIALMKGIATGQLAIDQDFEDNMYLCLGCRACESACPAGVKYGRLVENARDAIETVKSMNASKTTDTQSDQTSVATAQGGSLQVAADAITANGAATGTLPLKHTVKRTAKESFVRNLVFRRIFLYPSRIEKMGTVLWAAQTLGLQKLADKTGLMRILPRSMAEMQKAVPKVASPAARRKRRTVVPPSGAASAAGVMQTAGGGAANRTRVASAATGVVTAGAATSVPAGASTGASMDGSIGSKTIRVGMFKGCVMDVMFFEANEATARVLSKAGCEVVFVEDQACCGALHAHSGEQWGALDLAKRNIAAFEKAGIDYVVNNAGGCGAALREYGHWFEGDPEWSERAKAFVAKLMDANELLAKLPEISFTKEVHARVTYQDSCHLRHGQGIWKQPRELIRQLPGVEYVELPGADQCCGSAGIYNITNFDLSMKILDDKMGKVVDTKANVIVTSNPGCLLQMRQGIIRAGLSDHVEAVHIMELLDRAL